MKITGQKVFVANAQLLGGRQRDRVELHPYLQSRRLLQKGMIVIPASGRREHMAADLAAASLRLSDEEMAAIDALDRGDRMIDPAKAPDWDVLP